MKKNESVRDNYADQNKTRSENELHEIRSRNAKAEARDNDGRFTDSVKESKSDKHSAKDNKNDDCACSSTLGTAYADEKYHHEHGHPFGGQKHGGKYDERHHTHSHNSQADGDIVEVITITSYSVSDPMDRGSDTISGGLEDRPYSIRETNSRTNSLGNAYHSDSESSSIDFSRNSVKKR